MALTNDILFKDGVDWIDVKKKLKGDFNKAGDLSRFTNLENELSKIASKLFDCLPLVMQEKLLSGADGCWCRFNIRPIRKSVDLRNSVCSEMEDGDKFPVAVSDVRSIIGPLVTTEVTLDQVTDHDASFTSFSPTEMPVHLNLVADDQELLETTSDMVLQTRPVVQCSENNVATTIPDDSGMVQSSGTASEQITSELEAVSGQHTKEIDEPSLCLDIVEKEDVSLRRLVSATPEQVTNELETACYEDITKLDEPLLNLDIAEKDISSGNTVLSKPIKPAEPLQQLKIAPRLLTSTDSFDIESVCDLRRTLSQEAQDICSDAKYKVGEDGNFEQPQPPGVPPDITGWRLVKALEPTIQYVASHLGQGGFGAVFKAQEPNTGTLLAMKRVKFTMEDLDDVTKEVNIMNGLDHPNIIRVLGSQVQDMYFQIFLEWMAGGSVQDLLSQFGPMNAMVIQRYSEQVLSGVAYLHQFEILHCDIKGGNIVVDSTGQVAKLCDFGHALRMPVPDDTKAKGTVPFMAPELFDGSCNSPSSDVWSVGCTMVQMATGKQPWSEFHQIGEQCVMFQICLKDLPIPSSLPPLLKKVIADCLEKDVAKRPTARELQCRLAMPHLKNTSASPYLHEY